MPRFLTVRSTYRSQKMELGMKDFKPDKSKKGCYVSGKRGISMLHVSNLPPGNLSVLAEAYQVEPKYAWSFFLSTVVFALTPVLFLVLLKRKLCCVPTSHTEYHKIGHLSEKQTDDRYVELRKNNFSNIVCKGRCSKYEVTHHDDCDLSWKATRHNFWFHYTHKKWYWTGVEVPAMIVHLWDTFVGDLIYLIVADFYCVGF